MVKPVRYGYFRIVQCKSTTTCIVYSVHVELALRIALIHWAIHGCTSCAIDFSWCFWYGTLSCPFTFEGAKLLATSASGVEWCKSHAHSSFLSEVIQILICANSTCEWGIYCLQKYILDYSLIACMLWKLHNYYWCGHSLCI